MTTHPYVARRVARELIDAAEATGGATLDLALQSPTDGFIVGGIVPSLTIAPSDGLDHADKIRLTAGFVMRNSDIPGAYFGSWLDVETGIIHVDVSERFESETAARTASLARDEIAYWDVSGAREVRV